MTWYLFWLTLFTTCSVTHTRHRIPIWNYSSLWRRQIQSFVPASGQKLSPLIFATNTSVTFNKKSQKGITFNKKSQKKIVTFNKKSRRMASRTWIPFAVLVLIWLGSVESSQEKSIIKYLGTSYLVTKSFNSDNQDCQFWLLNMFILLTVSGNYIKEIL